VSVVLCVGAGQLQLRQRGPRAYVGGRPAFGYRADPDTRELVIDPAAAEIVRAIFDRARRGESVRAIAHAVGKHPTAIARVLAHESYKREHPGRIVDPKVFNAAQRALASRRRA
jgi:DNA invertase Pin-like site-specific DNA recombinase